jgi:ATP-dependent DNA ligase
MRGRNLLSSVPVVEAADLMHATLQKRPFSSADWLFEWKYDGFRCLVRKRGDQVDLISRQGNYLNGSFPDVVKAVAAVPGDFVLDAELAVGSGRGPVEFANLQQRARTVSPRSIPAAVRKCPARLYVFDMMMLGTRDIRDRPLVKRKSMLRDAFDDTPTLVYVTHVETVGELVFEQVLLNDFEGMVCKRKESLYVRGRTLSWIKVKNAEYSRPAALGFGRA